MSSKKTDQVMRGASNMPSANGSELDPNYRRGRQIAGRDMDTGKLLFEQKPDEKKSRPYESFSGFAHIIWPAGLALLFFWAMGVPPFN